MNKNKILNGTKKDKTGLIRLLRCLEVCLITLGVVSILYSVLMTPTNKTNLADVENIGKYYIEAKEVEVQLTSIETDKNKILISCIEDSSKFWVVDKRDFKDKKEDFETISIITDKNMDNILYSEQYEIDGQYYNLLNGGEPESSLQALDYNTYKDKEAVYLENVNKAKVIKTERLNGIGSIIVGMLLFMLEKYVKRL